MTADEVNEIIKITGADHPHVRAGDPILPGIDLAIFRALVSRIEALEKAGVKPNG